MVCCISARIFAISARPIAWICAAVRSVVVYSAILDW
jgi:hypothetical protein